MTRIIKIALVLSGSAVLGCSTPDNVAPDMAPRAETCQQSGTSENTCQRKNGKLVCHAYVFGTRGGPQVYPFKLVVRRPGEPVTVVWHLLEPGAKFLVNDGPQELKNNGEFKDGSPTNDEDGAPSTGNSGRKYRFTYLNTIQSPAGGHKYTIAYRTAAGQIARCDPNIENEAN